jgi:hypothetical protein
VYVCARLLVEYASKSHKLQSDLCNVLTVSSNQRSKSINRSSQLLVLGNVNQ